MILAVATGITVRRYFRLHGQEVSEEEQRINERMESISRQIYDCTMESSSQMALEEQRMQSRMLASIDGSADAAARNAGVAATFSLLNFLSRA